MAAKVKKDKISDDQDDIVESPNNRRGATKTAAPENTKTKAKNEPESPKTKSKNEPEAPPKKTNEKKRKKEGKGIAGKILPIFILLLIVVSLVGILYYNVFGIRDKYLRSTLEKIPIIGSLLPAPVDSTESKYSNLTRDELIAQITQLEAQVQTEKTNTDDSNKKIDIYLKEISDLKVFQDQQLTFKDEKATFDKMVAEGDPSAYAKYYESISPENAEDLYKSAVISVTQTKEVKNYISAIAAMDEKSAAKMLEELLVTNMDIVVNIMKGLSTDQRAAILSVMTVEGSTAVIKQMSPF